jgi:hypothetical protein
MSDKKMERGGKMHLPPIKMDSVAHQSHSEANKEHGMPKGFAPTDGYQGTEDGESHMGKNTTHED